MAGKSIRNTLTVTSGAYTIGDVVGGLITFPGATRRNGPFRQSKLNTITLGAVAALAYELWLFNSDIVTTALDNAPFALVAADELKYLGYVALPAASYIAVSSLNLITIPNVGIQVESLPEAFGTIYGYLKTTVVTTPGTTTLYLKTDWEYSV